MHNLIPAKTYLNSSTNSESLKNFMVMFEKNIKPDGVRNRAYLKLVWNRGLNKVTPAQNQSYFQSAQSNVQDGGKVREFSIMDQDILDLPIMKNIIDANIEIIKNFQSLKEHHELVLGLHFIQYRVEQYGASYSSPVGLHRDDEPLVFVHLLNLTPNAIGGDNLIADLDTREITNVVRLEEPFETLVLTRDYYHAVTALGSRKGEAKRDILLFTVEPSDTQVYSA